MKREDWIIATRHNLPNTKIVGYNANTGLYYMGLPYYDNLLGECYAYGFKMSGPITHYQELEEAYILSDTGYDFKGKNLYDVDIAGQVVYYNGAMSKNDKGYYRVIGVRYRKAKLCNMYSGDMVLEIHTDYLNLCR